MPKNDKIDMKFFFIVKCNIEFISEMQLDFDDFLSELKNLKFWSLSILAAIVQ